MASFTLSASTFAGARVQQARATGRTAAVSVVRCDAAKDVSRRNLLAAAVAIPALLPKSALALSTEDFKSPPLSDAQKERLAKLRSPGPAGKAEPGKTIPSLPEPPAGFKAPPKPEGGYIK